MQKAWCLPYPENLILEIRTITFKTQQIVDFTHNQAQKFASIAGGVEDRKKLGGYPKLGGVEIKLGG